MPEQAQQVITAVEAQQRRPHRYNIEINGEFAFAVHEDVLVKYRLMKGTVITDQLQLEVLAEEEWHAAYRYALRYIGRAMRSVKEIRDKLKMKGYSAETIQTVLDRLQQENYVNDAYYAAALTKQRLQLNKKGPLWIRRELQHKGIDKSKIDESLSAWSKEEEQEQALALASKRWPSIKGEFPERLRKIMGLLQRRGFTSGAVRYVTNRLRENASADELGDMEFEQFD